MFLDWALWGGGPLQTAKLSVCAHACVGKAAPSRSALERPACNQGGSQSSDGEEGEQGPREWGGNATALEDQADVAGKEVAEGHSNNGHSLCQDLHHSPDCTPAVQLTPVLGCLSYLG